MDRFPCFHNDSSAGNNFLKAAGHHDQTISILAGQMKFMLIMPKNPVAHHGWATKKILKFRPSKTASNAILEPILTVF